jgi:hypothetical protein
MEIFTNEYDWRFLLIFSMDDAELIVISEDDFYAEDRLLDSESFDLLFRYPNYQPIRIINLGVGVWILGNPYCPDEINSQIEAIAKDIGVTFIPNTKSPIGGILAKT